MDYTLENVHQLTKGVNKLFNAALKPAEKKDYLQIATLVNTKSHTVDYAWLGDLPIMKEWMNERQLKALSDHKYTIVKKDWEASIKVMRDDFLFDNLGIVKPKINQLVHAIDKHYNDLVADLITSNGVCYDGKKFFATHVVKVNGVNTNFKNISNKPLSEDELFKVYEFMTTIQDSNGTALNVKPNKLLVAPDLFKTARTILGAKTINATDNIAYNLLDLMVVSQMPAKSWAVLDATQELKPFILQISKPAKLSEDTTKMFDDKSVRYGVDTMDNAGYGFWQMAYFSSGGAAG